MSETIQKYRRLDFSKIIFSDKTLSIKEALKDIISIQWADDVLSGKLKVFIAEKC